MKPTLKDLRFNAQVKLKGKYGQAILAVIVPGLIGSLITSILNAIIGDIMILPTITTLIVNGGAGYMSIRMILRLGRNYPDADFSNSLAPSNRLGRYVLYALIIGAVSFLIQLPVNYAMFDTFLPSTDIIESTMSDIVDESGDITQLLSFFYTYIGMVLGLALLVALVTIPLYFTTYIIADEDISVIDAIKKSLQYSKGNILRIIGLNLSFIGWYIIVVFTFGIAIFYVAPYHQMAITNLYLSCKEEHGEDLGMYKRPVSAYEFSNQSDWMEEQNEEAPSNEWDF
jgi:uncharacterized membrane protein